MFAKKDLFLFLQKEIVYLLFGWMFATRTETKLQERYRQTGVKHGTRIRSFINRLMELFVNVAGRLLLLETMALMLCSETIGMVIGIYILFNRMMKDKVLVKQKN